MSKRRNLFRLLVIVCFFGLLVFGCKNKQENVEIDNWSNITNFQQLNGTWKLLSSLTFPVRENGGETWYSELEDYLLTIDSEFKKLTVSRKHTEIYSGGNIEIWEAWKEMWENSEHGDYTTLFNENNHSITSISNNLEQNLTNEEIIDILNSFKINQDGTKLKETVEEIDIILYKLETI